MGVINDTKRCETPMQKLQEIINTFGFSVPEATMAFGTFYELMCNPRGIAAAVGAKNMPRHIFSANSSPSADSVARFSNSLPFGWLLLFSYGFISIEIRIIVWYYDELLMVLPLK